MSVLFFSSLLFWLNKVNEAAHTASQEKKQLKEAATIAVASPVTARLNKLTQPDWMAIFCPKPQKLV